MYVRTYVQTRRIKYSEKIHTVQIMSFPSVSIDTVIRAVQCTDLLCVLAAYRGFTLVHVSSISSLLASTLVQLYYPICYVEL